MFDTRPVADGKRAPPPTIQPFHVLDAHGEHFPQETSNVPKVQIRILTADPFCQPGQLVANELSVFILNQPSQDYSASFASFFSKYSLMMSLRTSVLLVKPLALLISRNRVLTCPLNLSRMSKTCSFSDIFIHTK